MRRPSHHVALAKLGSFASYRKEPFAFCEGVTFIGEAGKLRLLSQGALRILRRCNARNPKIQNMLRMVGYGENLGSGFPTIISAWKDANWGEPELKNKFEIDEVELVLPIPVGGANDRVNDTINDTINDTLNDTLNDSVKTTYTIIRSNPGIQRKGIADISGKSVATTGRHLAILVKEGLIEHRDSDKTGGYYAK